MVSKRVLFGLLAVALLFGLLFAGCNDTTKVEIQKKGAPQIKEVSVAKTTNKDAFILTWDAVGGEDVQRYEVYFKKDDGSKSVKKLDNWAVNNGKYDPNNGSWLPNNDFDKWTVKLSLTDTYCMPLFTQPVAGGNYCFGIKTTSGSQPFNAESNIKWSSSYPFTEAKPNVSLTKTTAGSSLIFKWDSIDAARVYQVQIFKEGNSVSVGSISYGWGHTVYDENGTDTGETDPKTWSVKSLISDFPAIQSGDVIYVKVTPRDSNDVSCVLVAGQSSSVPIP